MAYPQLLIFVGTICNNWGLYGKFTLMKKDCNPSFTGGVIKKIGNQFNLLLGVGFSSIGYDNFTSAETGVMYVHNKMNILVGVQYHQEDYDRSFGVFAGVGINF